MNLTSLSHQAPGQQQLERLYGINEIAASSGLTLYVLGFAFGPLICQILLLITPSPELLIRRHVRHRGYGRQ